MREIDRERVMAGRLRDKLRERGDDKREEGGGGAGVEAPTRSFAL